MAPSATVFRGVRVFDGRQPTLTGPSDVVVRGNTVESVGPAGGGPGPDARKDLTAGPAPG